MDYDEDVEAPCRNCVELAANVRRLRDRVAELEARLTDCPSCKAPRGSMGCEGCDADLCPCCVAGHDCSDGGE